jgi:hypothetical protein
MVKELDPAGLERRTKDLHRQRGEYITPGPNFIWSIDGHDKLSHWGFQIYAGIDAKSRYVLWDYCGVSNRTAVSVGAQFLEVLRVTGTQPSIIRSDRGKETPIVADLHYRLRQKSNPDVKIADCYLYGPSTSNQRIESWWSQLTRGQVNQWRVCVALFFTIISHNLSNYHTKLFSQTYFTILQTSGQWRKDSLGDRIALTAVYMPIIRRAVHGFVRIWNSHTIRKQANRPGTLSGVPLVNYECPELYNARDYGVRVDQQWVDEEIALYGDFGKLKLLITLSKLVLTILIEILDIEEYLPPLTLQWCTREMDAINYDPNSVKCQIAKADGERPYIDAYIRLRHSIRKHIDFGAMPALSEIIHPLGSSHWLTAREAQGRKLLELAPDEDELPVVFSDDGPDPGMVDGDFDEALE